MKYKILNSEITGVNGKAYYKGQIVDESQLIAGSIDNLISTGAIEKDSTVEVIEEPKKETKKTVKTE